MANTCASSWVSTIPQLKAWLVGACEVMIRPKQTPETPMAGRPDGSNREVARIGVELERDRPLRLEAIAGDVVAVALFEEGATTSVMAARAAGSTRKRRCALATVT